jgi:membrane-bound ClpP family serine protease
MFEHNLIGKVLMFTSYFTKSSGLAGLLGGILLPVFMLFHPERDAHAVLNSPYALILVLPLCVQAFFQNLPAG